jgi:saccharopine dehydrogenase-like NADP-dependent oxidoreductase
MSGLENFIIAGSGTVGSHIARELLQLKNAGKINNVTILTRSVSFY